MFNFSSKTIVNKEYKVSDFLTQIKASKEVRVDAKKIKSIVDTKMNFFLLFDDFFFFLFTVFPYFLDIFSLLFFGLYSTSKFILIPPILFYH